MEFKNALEAAGLTDPKVAALKKAHGKLWVIEVENPEGNWPHVFVLKQPDRKTLSAAAKVGHTDPYQAGEIVVKNCLVHGDAALLEDVTIFSAVSAQFEKVNQARAATIKNL
jgi:hypothetical protein